MLIVGLLFLIILLLALFALGFSVTFFAWLRASDYLAPVVIMLATWTIIIVLFQHAPRGH